MDDSNDSSSPRRVLVVDDDDAVRRAVERWLVRAEFEVDGVSNGVDAIDHVRDTPYDVVTMDIQMPGMSGIEAISRIRALRPDIPIIVISGYYSEEGELHRLKPSLVLTKPVSLADLEAEVRKLLH